jgi:hypothetical protein
MESDACLAKSFCGSAIETSRILIAAERNRSIISENIDTSAGPEIPVHPNSSAMFAIEVVTTIGNDESTLFWSDRWLGCLHR